MNSRAKQIMSMLSVAYRHNYKEGYLESDGRTPKEMPIREGKPYQTYAAESAYAEGWNAKVYLTNEGREK